MTSLSLRAHADGGTDVQNDRLGAPALSRFTPEDTWQMRAHVWDCCERASMFYNMSCSCEQK